MRKSFEKTGIAAWALVFCLAFFCLAPVALAQEARASEDTPTAAYDNLYYFSDFHNASQFYNGVLLGLQNAGNIHFEQIQREGTDSLEYMYSTGVFGDVEQGSLVIIELRSMSRDYYGLLFCICSELKNDDCKIMLINGVEEVKMLDMSQSDYTSTCDNAFLDYVDIHINLDIFSVFMDTVFYRHEENGVVKGTTFLLDGSFLWDEILSYGFPDYVNGWSGRAYDNDFYAVDIFDWHILRYFYYYFPNEDVWMDFLQTIIDNGIKIFCHVVGGNYFNLLTGEYISIEQTDSFLSATENENMLAIGTSWRGEDYLSEWLYPLMSFREREGLEFPVYFFNDFNYALNCPSDQNFFAAYGTAYFETNILPDIVRDFADDVDLSIYDNWDGRCVVTHKPIYPGEGGWLNCFMRFHPVVPH